jgi:hypothetical protein
MKKSSHQRLKDLIAQQNELLNAYATNEQDRTPKQELMILYYELNRQFEERIWFGTIGAESSGITEQITANT